jgi:hypothetical protein
MPTLTEGDVCGTLAYGIADMKDGPLAGFLVHEMDLGILGFLESSELFPLGTPFPGTSLGIREVFCFPSPTQTGDLNTDFRGNPGNYSAKIAERCAERVADLAKGLPSRKGRTRQRILGSDHPQPEANIPHR